MNSATKLIAAFAFVCTAFSSGVNAATIDFKVTDLNEVSLGPDGYITGIPMDGAHIGVAQHWGVGVPDSSDGSTRDVALPAENPLPLYWETYTFLINTSGASWPYDAGFNIGVYTDSDGNTKMTMYRIPGYGLSSFDSEGGTMTIDPSGITTGQSGIYYDIFFDLEQSWVDFGNGRIYLSQFGQQPGPGILGGSISMDIESGYFKEAHIVYKVMAVPEPETWAMLLAGLGLMAGVTRRRRANR
ncbi:MAG: PEPxxWA-CTERM sorting domain-containing protein [Betaproteobacteria bacterium]|nr:PEPxxWA-CTERM sorting domain-containing protein [Betaproteobacteria bacterium]